MAEINRRFIRLEPYLVAGVASTYFVLYSVLSVLRHVTYHSFGPDLGIFDQVFWNTVHGRFLESTMSLAQAQPHSYLADHFSPVYLLLMPAYALIPRPETLLVIQTLFLAVIRVIIPAFGSGSYEYFSQRINYRYAELGRTLQEILSTVFAHPRRLAQILLQPQKLKFLVGIFGPVLGLTAISRGAAILVLPTLGILLLSNYAPQYAFTSHYSAPLIALVIGTSILGFARLRPSFRGPAAAGVLASSLVFSFLFGDLPFSRHFDVHMFEPEARYTAFVGNLDRIPPDASVGAENNLTPHLSHRRFIYNLEFEGANNAEYVALDDAALGRNLAAFQQQIASFEAIGYRTIATGDGLALMQ